MTGNGQARTDRPSRPVIVLVLFLAALVASGSGCGVRSEDSPRVLSVEDVPFGLLAEPSSTPTTVVPAPSVARATVVVFLVRNARMYPVLRQVNAPPTVAKSLTALLFGPQENEVSQGIRSAINPAAAVQARSVDPTTFLVDLSAEFTQGPISEQVLGLAQIVYTATGITGVEDVRFTLNGAPIEVPTPSGSLTSAPIDRDAFVEFAPLTPSVDQPS